MNTSVGCKELMRLDMVVGREIRKRREDKEERKEW